MDPVDFYRLARPAQERFVGSVNGTGLPAPILGAPSRPLAPFVGLGASAASFVVLLLLLSTGYGDLASPAAKHGTARAIIDVALAALAVFGAVHSAGLRAEHRSSPFRRGVYVFPVGLIDARTPTLRLYPIESLGEISGPDARGLTLDFDGKPFSFPVRDPEVVATVKTELAGARGAMGDADAARESIRPKALAALDPLQGYANPLASSDSMVEPVQQWATFAWAIAAVLGVVVGGSLWMLRNAKSDDVMYAHAVAANDASSFRAYLDNNGTRHAAEVSSVLLPRALLVEAEHVGTVDAIEAFIAAHPQTPIASEAAAALKAALLAELDVAVKAGTLAALDDFSRRRSDAHLDAELARARHGVYQAALDRYVKEAPEKAPPTPFVERLLAWVEKKGPGVEIRFHHQKSKAMEKADGTVGKNAQFKGVVSLPSHYFEDAATKPNQDALAAAVIRRFAAVFPPEILVVTMGAPLADTDVPFSVPITSPTLFVDHGETWSGAIQASRNPRGVFVGLELTFEADFRIPDATKPLKVKLDAWHMPSVAVAKGADPPEGAVYADMRQKGYDPFQKKLLGALFRDGT